MTDAPPLEPIDPNYDFATDPDGVTAADVDVNDVQLHALLDFQFGVDQEDSASELGLTLLINGALVTGRAIPYGRWLREYYAQLRMASQKLAEGIEAVFTDVNAEGKAIRDRRDTENRPNVAIKHIHMRDVIVRTGNVTLNVPLWRAELEHVDGWSLGAASV